MLHRFNPGVLAVLLLALGGCFPSKPTMEFELLSPKAGEVAASITARLVVTGAEDVSYDAHIKVIDARYPNTDFRSVWCYRPCEAQEIQVPSGTFEVFGTMTYSTEEGEERTVTTERHRVEIDATPIAALVLPTGGPRQIKVLFTRPVLASSVNTDTLRLERTFQSGTTRLQTTTEPVAFEASLTDRTLTLTGEFSAPARYVLHIQGVRDAPGNKVVQDLPFDRHYFAHGPDLYESSPQPLEWFERDEQQRLYQLGLNSQRQQVASRLEGNTWVEFTTPLPVGDRLATLDRQGRPVAFTTPDRGGDVLLKRWNGSAWEAWGPAIHETAATGFFFVQVHVDDRNRPFVLVTSGANAPVTNSTHLYRLDGEAWTSLPHAIAAGTVDHTFFPLGNALALGWATRSSGGDSLSARIEEDGLGPATVLPGSYPVWSRAVPAGPDASYVPKARFSGLSAVMRYDGQSLTELGEMRSYLDPSDPTGGNTLLGEVRTLAVDETGAPTVFLHSRIYAGTTDGVANYRFILGALRFDGHAWVPLRGAPAAVLQSSEPEVAWMSSLALGSTPVALEAAYTPTGGLWMLQLRGYSDGRVARTYPVRAYHAP